MAAKLIGFIDCPICSFHGVALKEDKKGKATFYADCCGFQGQSRDEKADKKLRGRVFEFGGSGGDSIKSNPVVLGTFEKGEVVTAEKVQKLLDEKPKAKTFAEAMGL